ncbi:MAG: alpha-glucan family phosphorylase [Pseudomonadota bacterium]
MTPIDPFLQRTHIAYFSMEIALRSEMHTYSGGLGVLAGDTARSCADLELPVVFVTLVSRSGYFQQAIDSTGRQIEHEDRWDPAAWSVPLGAMVAVQIEKREVWIRPWLYIYTCPLGHSIPILLLDTDLEENSENDRQITHDLYGRDEAYRLKQEIVLGIGGVRVLQALGFSIHTYHLNEGHAALLAIELLHRFRQPVFGLLPGESAYDVPRVRNLCIFTTHTPVEAGHDRFSYDMVERILEDLIEIDELKRLGGSDRLNMTRLALELSGYVNGVARRHAETANHMFPGFHIRAITNGVHVGMWTHDSFARLYQASFPHWCHEPEVLVRADQLDDAAVWSAHREAKKDLLALIERRSGVAMDLDRPILAFARRMTGYKRPTLLFANIDRLAAIARRFPFQVVVAGKAHPHDGEGKRLIEEINGHIRTLKGTIPAVFLPNHDLDLAKVLVAGADLWLNTPQPPMEASGTSGMKAALNGVLNISALDGWWIEACIEGVTGWAIGQSGDVPSWSRDADALYDKLEHVVLPLYHDDRARWTWMMKQAISKIASHFNSQRMMRRYATEAYIR